MYITWKIINKLIKLAEIDIFGIQIEEGVIGMFNIGVKLNTSHAICAMYDYLLLESEPIHFLFRKQGRGKC